MWDLLLAVKNRISISNFLHLSVWNFNLVGLFWLVFYLYSPQCWIHKLFPWVLKYPLSNKKPASLSGKICFVKSAIFLWNSIISPPPPGTTEVTVRDICLNSTYWFPFRSRQILMTWLSLDWLDNWEVIFFLVFNSLVLVSA